MVQRLITLVSKIDRIFSNGLVNINFNFVAQVQLRYYQSRQFLSQSSAHFSYKPPEKIGRPLHPNWGNNGGGGKMEENETTENKRIDKRTNNLSSTSPPKSPPKAPNESPKLGGNSGSAGDRNKKSPRLALDKQDTSTDGFSSMQICLSVGFAIAVCMYGLFHHLGRNHCYEEITWEDFAEKYLAQGRIAKVKVLDKNWLLVHTAPGASADAAKTFRLRLDSLDSYKIATPVTSPTFVERAKMRLLSLARRFVGKRE